MTRSGEKLYMVKGGTTYRILSDQVGSVRLVVNATPGAVAQRIDYDAFGNPTYVTGPPDFQPFGFAGGLTDLDTGPVRFGARDYDPRVGRWTSKDAIDFAGGDPNLYAYAISDPVNFLDADGREYTISDQTRTRAVGQAVMIRETFRGPLTFVRPAACAISGIAVDCTSEAAANGGPTEDDVNFINDLTNYCSQPSAPRPRGEPPAVDDPAGRYNGRRSVNDVSHSRGPKIP